jgi:putative membrane protein
MRKSNYIIVLALLLLGFQACQQRSKDSVELAEDANNISDDSATFRTVPDLGVVTNENYSDANFAVQAAEGGMAEEQLGKIALTNAQNQQVKDFGQKMVNDHAKANQELMAIAKEKGIVLPTAVSRERSEHMADLNSKSGAEFDKDYMDMMVNDHKSTVQLFETAAEHATDAEIKAFAVKTLPSLKQHLKSAELLKNSLNTN